MKVIISRKGLDTTSHNEIKEQNNSKSKSFSHGSSPIFKDCMFSLPSSFLEFLSQGSIDSYCLNKVLKSPIKSFKTFKCGKG